MEETKRNIVYNFFNPIVSAFREIILLIFFRLHNTYKKELNTNSTKHIVDIDLGKYEKTQMKIINMTKEIFSILF